MSASMPMWLEIFAYVCCLMFLCFRGGDINVHADAASDICVCFSSYVLLLSWGGGGAGWEMGWGC